MDLGCHRSEQFAKLIRGSIRLAEDGSQRTSIELGVIGNNYLGERLIPSQNDMAAVLAFDSKAGLEER